MNRIALFAIIIVVFFLFVRKMNGGTRISAKDVHELIQNGEKVIVLDVRTEMEYQSGHIEGAMNLSVYDIGSERPASLSDLDQLIVVYCQSGARSGIAVRKLKDLGYTNVRNMGGLQFWRYGLVK